MAVERPEELIEMLIMLELIFKFDDVMLVLALLMSPELALILKAREPNAREFVAMVLAFCAATAAVLDWIEPY